MGMNWSVLNIMLMYGSERRMFYDFIDRGNVTNDWYCFWLHHSVYLYCPSRCIRAAKSRRSWETKHLASINNNFPLIHWKMAKGEMAPQWVFFFCFFSILKSSQVELKARRSSGPSWHPLKSFLLVRRLCFLSKVNCQSLNVWREV